LYAVYTRQDHRNAELRGCDDHRKSGMWEDAAQMQRLTDALAQARAAFDAGEWAAAAQAYEAVRGSAEASGAAAAAALDGLGQVRWLQGRVAEGMGLRERAYAEYCRLGDRAAAAGTALWLMVEYTSSRGSTAVANGWFLRAERLLEDVAPCPAHVELEIARARRSEAAAAAEAHFARALEVARELGSVNAEVRVLTVLGVHRVSVGRVRDGMAMLDHAMAAVLGGELTDPWTVGSACCQMLAGCDAAGDWPRAMEWCRELVPFVEREGFVPLWAWCRSMYGGVLTAVGEWERAEAELLDSLRTFGGPGEPMAVYPLARLAELRIRQGRYEEAERLVEDLEDHPRAVTAGIGVLLARGKAQAAAAVCERRLERIGEGSAGGAALLPLLVEARLALGDVAGAAEVVGRLGELARSLERPDLTAAAEMAAADVSLATGDGAAAAHLGAALELFGRLGMPLECGRARLGLARLHAAGGEAELAVEEAKRALRVFERLGARPDADAAAALLRDLGAAGRSGPRLGGELTARELEVLALLGEGCSNAQIAERLVIAPKTAEHHVSRILRKLDLASRAEAAAHAARAGITRSTAARSR
jgi:DNA-binding CsgD family transcriptional regulator